jgi:hypothetical protein
VQIMVDRLSGTLNPIRLVKQGKITRVTGEIVGIVCLKSDCWSVV